MTCQIFFYCKTKFHKLILAADVIDLLCCQVRCVWILNVSEYKASWDQPYLKYHIGLEAL